MSISKENYEKKLTELTEKLGNGNPIYIFDNNKMAYGYIFDYLEDSDMYFKFVIPLQDHIKMVDIANQLEKDDRIGVYNLTSNLTDKTITIKLMALDETVSTLFSLTNDLGDLINI